MTRLGQQSESSNAEPGLMRDIPTTGSIQLPPDPRSLEALGRHHSLEAALAELVDNSLDARADHVLIRFVRDGDRLIRLLIADDGRGMAEDGIDVARRSAARVTTATSRLVALDLGSKQRRSVRLEALPL